MKKMLLILAVGLALNASAQSSLKWKGIVGLNISNLGKLGTKPGFHIGAKAQYKLPAVTNGLYVNAGALLSLKGAKKDFGDFGHEKVNAYSLDLPIHLGYSYDINKYVSVFGEAGPYISLGMFGKIKVEHLASENGMFSRTKVKSDFDTFADNSLKRFDVGAGFNAGFEYKQTYSLAIGYDWGFLNVRNHKSEANDSQDNGGVEYLRSLKNGNLTLTFGYTF